ncbi:MAG: 16S rRNA processing protein RimM [Bacilli bacterium]|nr:16S rRNA processing protein RimM [Bacilli bacterium]
MKYVLLGKIVNTHGLKGEVRILSSFKYKDRVFKEGMKVYIGKDKVCEEINSYRYHKIFDMITMNGYNNINEILKYKGEYIFINKEDLVLNEGEYLDEDIIGLNVYVEDRLLGRVKKIEKHSVNEILVIENDKKNYLVPYNFDIIIDIDLEKKEMHVKNIVGLFD